MPESQPIDIRWMIERDREGVIAIDSLCYLRRIPRAELDVMLSKYNCIGLVAERGDRIVGFMIYDVLRDSYHIRNLAVDPDYQRMGIGSQLVDRMIGRLSRRGRNHLTTVVRERSIDAQLFLKAQGFLANKVVREFYSDTGEDGYCMTCTLGSHAAVKGHVLL